MIDIMSSLNQFRFQFIDTKGIIIELNLNFFSPNISFYILVEQPVGMIVVLHLV